tara:strand:- start:694 stop:876 length:183 start_codon:yes stop_codon:yes gene_type:complete
MGNLKIIAEALGLSLTKRPSGYQLNKGYNTQGIIFQDLESVTKHLVKEINWIYDRWDELK